MLRTRKLKRKSASEVFTSIYQDNGWNGNHSVSGRGSDDDQTAVIVESLPRLFSAYQVTSVLDVPCGDFHWMKKVDLSSIDYIGADIVSDLISSNTNRYASKLVSFRQLDLIRDPLPRVDLVFCRDCLVHLSFDDTFAALENILRSRAKYLLTTTFTDRERNRDIVTGEWRALNLELAPFDFPPPIALINEKCTESGNAFSDKSLGLWKISDISGRHASDSRF
jgi:SAM-dependent methyltransferase